MLLTRATNVEFETLRSNAILLGGSTSKSATEVAQLQQELAKKGFSASEINKSTEAIINLSIAAGSDLATSATVAGATLRGFQKDSKEMGHISDVMALSFTKTGLDLEKFGVGMANAQVAAKSTGQSFEFTTAALGTLVDTGTDASKAGTDLRAIFAKLTIAGISLDDAYKMVNNSSNKVATAQKLVGDRAFSSLITLSEQSAKVDNLTKSFEDANGAALEMANTMEDNLIGDFKKASSAWERLILSIENGEGVISNAFRNTTQWVTDFINSITDTNEVMVDLKETEFTNLDYWFKWRLTKSVGDFGIQLNHVVASANKLNEADLNALIIELNEQMADLSNETKDGRIKIDLIKKALSELAVVGENLKMETFKDALKVLGDEAIVEGADAVKIRVDELTGKILELQKANKSLEGGEDNGIWTFPTEDELSRMDKNNEFIKIYTDEIKRLNESLNKTNDPVEKFKGLIPKLQNDLKLLREAQKSTWDTTEILEYQRQIEALQEKIKSLTDTTIESIDTLKSRNDFDLFAERDPLVSEETKLSLLEDMFKKADAISAENLKNRKKTLKEFLLDPDVKESASKAVSVAQNVLTNLNQKNIELSQERIDTATTEIERLKGLLNEETELKRSGKANDVALIEQQIEEEQAAKKRAIAENRKQQKIQEQIDTAVQISSLITAVANIIKGWSNVPIVGSVLGLAAAGATFAGFIASKAKAKSAAGVQNFAEGTERVTGAGTETSDSVPANLSINERVVPAKENKKLLKHGIKNHSLAELAILGKNIKDGKITGWDMVNVNSSQITQMHNSGMLAELRNGNNISKQLLKRPQYAIMNNKLVSIDNDGNIKVINKV